MGFSTVHTVVEKLRPTFPEHVTNGQYWSLYEDELNYLLYVFDAVGTSELIHEVNGVLAGYYRTTAAVDACVDVASTLESLLPEVYAGKFKY